MPLELNFIDKFLGFISPGLGLKRATDRAKLNHIRSAQYAAAGAGRMLNGWNPGFYDINDLIRNSTSAKARIAQLVRDTPQASRAVKVTTDYIIGPGISHQSRVKKKNGKLDTKANEIIEAEYRRFKDEKQFDLAKKITLDEGSRLAIRYGLISGEHVILKHYPKNRRIPLAYQIVDPEWLNSGIRTVSNRGDIEVDQGIVYDSNTGEVTGYYFSDPNNLSPISSKLIPANRVIHKFDVIGSGQRRGIPQYMSAVLLMHNFSDYTQSELEAARMMSKILLVVEKENAETANIPLFGKKSGTGESGEDLYEIDNGASIEMQPGHKANVNIPGSRPGENFATTVRLFQTLLSVAFNLPYEVLTQDYSGANYTQMRVGRNDFYQTLQEPRARAINHFHIPIFADFFEMAMRVGIFNFRDYWQNPMKYLGAQVFQGPGDLPLDPLKEGKAEEGLIKNSIGSPIEMIRKRGGDPEKILDDLAQYKQMAEERGLQFGSIDNSLASANNPAAIMDQKDVADLISLAKRIGTKYYA